MEGINYIPEELRGPIFKANKAPASKADPEHISFFHVLFFPDHKAPTRSAEPEHHGLSQDMLS